MPKTMYHRSQNENGSFNTRCLDCFLTVASCVESEEELEQIEAGHLCPERVLSEVFREALHQQNAVTLKKAAGF